MPAGTPGGRWPWPAALTACSQGFQPPVQDGPGSISFSNALRCNSSINCTLVAIASPSTPGSDCAMHTTLSLTPPTMFPFKHRAPHSPPSIQHTLCSTHGMHGSRTAMLQAALRTLCQEAAMAGGSSNGYSLQQIITRDLSKAELSYLLQEHMPEERTAAQGR
jgi:hypothetical protein